MMGPFWAASGLLLTLDMIFPPYGDLAQAAQGLEELRPAWVSGVLPAIALIAGADAIFSLEVAQKLTLTLALALAAYGGWSLLSRFRLRLAAVIAGAAFYAANPFVYARFFGGQWKILLGYAAIPLAVGSLMDLMEQGSRRNLAKVVLWTWLAGVFSVHMLALTLGVQAAVVMAHLASKGRRAEAVRRLPTLGAALALGLAASADWLLPALTTERLPGVFDGRDLSVFSSAATTELGIPADVALMLGFWQQGFADAFGLLPPWSLVGILATLVALTVAGGWALWARNRAYAAAFTIVGVASLFLGSGIHAPWGGVNEWLYLNVPFLSGFRDTHKFVGALALVYALFIAFGLDWGLSRVQGLRPAPALVLLLLAAAALVPGSTVAAFHEGSRAYRPVEYPGDWVAAREFLQRDDSDHRVLFFPWHAYMSMSWNPVTFANQSQAFFGEKVIRGLNVEVPGIESQVTDPVQDYVGFLLARRDEIDNLGELVAPLNVRYVMLVQEADFQSYGFLRKQADLNPVFRQGRIVIYENAYETSRVSSVDGVTTISGWDELLQRSRSEDITRSLYLLEGDGAPALGSYAGNGGPLASEAYFKVMRSGYRAENPDGESVITFVESYAPQWEVKGAAHVANFGVTNAYVLDEPGASLEITNARYGRVYFPGYLVTAVGLMALAAIAVWGGRPLRRRGR